MWPEPVRGVRQRWVGFADRLGERIVVERSSGLRSVGLLVAPALVEGEASLQAVMRDVAQVTDVSHPALRAPREVELLPGAAGRPVLVTDYLPGRRLSEWLANRAGAGVATGTALHVARQVAGALLALADHAPGTFHGAVGLDRVVLTPRGQVLLVEPGLGALLASHSPRTPAAWWRDYRLAVPVGAGAPAFGPATDACQLGVLVLELLLGRPLGPDDYPDAIATLLGTAEETDLTGQPAPLGAALFDWLSLALGLGSGQRAPTIHAVAEALEQMLTDEGGYVAVPLGLDVTPEVLQPCVDSATPVSPPVATGPVDPVATHPAAGGEPEGLREPKGEPQDRPPAAKQGPGPEDPWPDSKEVYATIRWQEPGQGSGLTFARDADAAAAAHEPVPPPARAPVRPRVPPGPPARLAARERTPGWRPILRWGAVAVAVTIACAGAAAGWRSWRERTINQQTAVVRIDSNPTGAVILIDGVERGRAPVSLAVLPGHHDIVAKSASGSGRSSVTVEAGRMLNFVVPLEFGTDPGFVELTTEPPGAQVTLDAVAVGRTPLALERLAPGDHTLTVEIGAARLERRFTLAPAERLTVFVPLAGWVAVRSGVPVEVYERGRHLGASGDGRVLVPSGRRRLQFVNRELGVNLTQDVIVQSGTTESIAIPLSAGVLSVSSDPPAQVWVNGEPRGHTPTGNLSVPIGQHEVLVSHPTFGEQRLTVLVGLGAPTRLSVKLAPETGRRGYRGSANRSGISAAR